MKKIVMLAALTIASAVFAQAPAPQSARTMSLADAKNKIAEAIQDSRVMADIMQSVSNNVQVAFLAAVNEAIAARPGSTEEKVALFLAVNSTALKTAGEGNLQALLATTFSTVSLEALPAISERFAADLFNRDADPTRPISDEQFLKTVTDTMAVIVSANEGKENAGVNDTFAVLMFAAASNGRPEGIVDQLVSTLPSDVQDIAKSEWIPAAQSGDYDGMLASLDSDVADAAVAAAAAAAEAAAASRGGADAGTASQGGADGAVTAGQGGADGSVTAGQGGADAGTASQGGADGAVTAGQGGADGAVTAGQGGADGSATAGQGGADGSATAGQGGADGSATAGQGGADGSATAGQGGADGSATAGQGAGEPLVVPISSSASEAGVALMADLASVGTTTPSATTATSTGLGTVGIPDGLADGTTAHRVPLTQDENAPWYSDNKRGNDNEPGEPEPAIEEPDGYDYQNL